MATTKVSTEWPEFRMASGKRRHTQALAYSIEEIKHAFVTNLEGWSKHRLMQRLKQRRCFKRRPHREERPDHVGALSSIAARISDR
jgi:hypothetical protein